MQKFKIKRDDVVVVIAGKHKGQTGKVVRVLRDREAVLVEKVNLVKRSVRAQQGRQGGIVEKEAPIHISNVALWNAEEQRPVKVGYKFLEDGRKVRFDKKTGQSID
jgi:large subunit ribosomal protein L24